uniref:Uncharacterized protein n=1 Tax=Ciona savignyi TaxID=51511 RepID=H2ZIT2_CIOSA
MKMFGLSDHDLMFSQKPDDFEYDEEAITGLSNKVQEAQNKLQMESNQFTGKEETEQRWGRFIDDRFSDPKTFKDVEPVFPIEGIAMKLENLQIPSPPKFSPGIIHVVSEYGHKTDQVRTKGRG